MFLQIDLKFLLTHKKPRKFLYLWLNSMCHFFEMRFKMVKLLFCMHLIWVYSSGFAWQQAHVSRRCAWFQEPELDSKHSIVLLMSSSGLCHQGNLQYGRACRLISNKNQMIWPNDQTLKKVCQIDARGPIKLGSYVNS